MGGRLFVVPAISDNLKRLRWAAPIGVLGLLLASFATLPRVTAQTPSGIAAIGPQQLVAKAVASHVPQGAGTLNSTADLGLPDLGSALSMGPLGPLLSGTHTLRVSWSGQKQHLAVLDSLDETDLIHNGRDVWVWQSRPARAAHVTLPDRSREAAGQPVSTPDVIAKRMLDAIGPYTDIAVGDPRSIAGRSAYALVLKPKSSSSLIDHILISIDAKTGMPLGISVFAVGATKPAIEIAFTRLSFDSPPTSDFVFVPPPGATVQQSGSVSSVLSRKQSRRGRVAMRGIESSSGAPDRRHQSLIGSGWETVVVLPAGALSGERLGDLIRTAPPASGAWGSGRLIHTTLLHALVVDNGPVLAGAVTDAMLESAAGRLQH